MQEIRFVAATISVPKRKLDLTTEKGQKVEMRFLDRWAWFVELLAFIAKRMKELPSRKVIWYDVGSEIEKMREEGKPLTLRSGTSGLGLAASFHKFWAVHIHESNRRYFQLSPETTDKTLVTKSFFGVEHSDLHACYWLKVPVEQIDMLSEESIITMLSPTDGIPPAEPPSGRIKEREPVTGERSMGANLDKILELLDEEKIARAVSIKHDEARERYSLAKATVGNYNEFVSEITKYYVYHFRKTLADANPPTEIATQNALELVQQAYASQGGLEAAYRDANVGTGGGLRAVIDSIYEALKREQEEKYVNHVLTTQVNPLDWDDRVALMNQYLGKFGRYLPAGTKSRSAEQLANNYGELIKLHAKVVGAIRARIRL